jgi:hypothetical protein
MSIRSVWPRTADAHRQPNIVLFFEWHEHVVVVAAERLAALTAGVRVDARLRECLQAVSAAIFDTDWIHACVLRAPVRVRWVCGVAVGVAVDAPPERFGGALRWRNPLRHLVLLERRRCFLGSASAALRVRRAGGDDSEEFVDRHVDVLVALTLTLDGDADPVVVELVDVERVHRVPFGRLLAQVVHVFDTSPLPS